MKNLSFINKFIFFINNIFALLFLASFIIPYISPETFPTLSVLSLLVPFLLFVHIIFIIYWILLGFKKQFYLSTICILLAIIFNYFPYKFDNNNIEGDSTFSVMNYNVRLFNRFEWIEDKEIPLKISNLIKNSNPDILCIQEFFPSKEIEIDYPYKYVELRGEKHDFGQAIYSKYKIINKGSLNFKNTANNAIFVDIIKGGDTIRIYNLHLQSLGLSTNKEYLGQENSEKMLKRLSNSFIKQQKQVEVFLAHKNQCKTKLIISGDFNNTSYSWVYNQIKSDMIDTFNIAGTGFGKTFDIQKYPLRIDFILTDKDIKVNQHINFKQQYSDHFPVFAKLKF